MSDASRTPGGQPVPEISAWDLWRVFWMKLREMRTVFQLLFFIAGGALICAIVPQGLESEEYYHRYGRFLGNIITRLGFDHVYTATWFLLLLGILLLSLVACSGRLWKQGAARWRMPEAAEAQERAKSATHVAQADTAPAETMTALAASARRHGYHPLPLVAEGTIRVTYLHKHRWSAWGQTIAHYAVFLIAIGSLMGSLPGLSLDRQANIREGDTYHSEDGAVPFDVRVDKFRIARKSGIEAVDNYYSDVTLLAEGKELTRAQISVNRPLRYQGYFVSQVNWSLGEAKIEVTREGKTTPIAFPLARADCPEMDSESSWGVPVESAAAFLPGGHSAFVVTGFLADSTRQGNEIVGLESEYPGQPALNLTLVSGLPGKMNPGPATGKPSHSLQEIGWFQPGMSRPLPGGGSVKFVGITQITGLGIRRDSGLSLVWAGFIACMVGLALIFYVPLQRCVLSCEPRDAGRSTIRLGGYGCASDPALDDFWTELLQAVQAEPVRCVVDDKEEASSA